VSESMQLRVMSFNIHGGRPPKGPPNLEAIAQVIREHRPDLVGLQEISGFLPSTKLSNQPRELSKLVGMEVAFGPSLGIGPIGFGNAILSRQKAVDVRLIRLPMTFERNALEPRTALEVKLVLEGRTLRFVTTHLGLTPNQRLRQASALISHLSTDPTIVTGDLNALSGAPEIRAFASVPLVDCATDDQATFPSLAPRLRIDYVLAAPAFRRVESFTVDTLVSDHRPLVVDLILP
jgi:endonuclease/exonuclease/phosphatase family metal-dependent hydrolase